MGAQGSKFDSQAEVAAKLASKKPCLLAFMSPQCGLCASLRPSLREVEQAGGVRVAWIDATLDRVWAPELLRYDVEAVPCLVLLRGDGHAVCKTGQPSTARQMAADMEQMLREVGA